MKTAIGPREPPENRRVTRVFRAAASFVPSASAADQRFDTKESIYRSRKAFARRSYRRFRPHSRSCECTIYCAFRWCGLSMCNVRLETRRVGSNASHASACDQIKESTLPKRARCRIGKTIAGAGTTMKIFSRPGVVQAVIWSFILFAPFWASGGEALRTPSPARKAGLTRDDFLPADVLSRVRLLHDELELVRSEMGRPINLQSELQVTQATPREVYFQALTMFRKANRLARDLTASRSTEPKTPSVDQIQPGDVWAVADAALARLLVVKRRLGITAACSEQPMPLSTTPTDVYRSIVQANRQLNLPLEAQFVPSDVFQQVTLAVHYTERLLQRFPSATARPTAPPMERGKQPSDVYRRLVRCYGLVRTIAEQSHVEMLSLPVADEDIRRMSPSDVYDIASLLVSELAYLHALLDDAQSPDEVFYPGRRFPSHVFQRAGILEAQLLELQKLTKEHPDWLRLPIGSGEGGRR
jgi:hypothetical protein